MNYPSKFKTVQIFKKSEEEEEGGEEGSVLLLERLLSKSTEIITSSFLGHLCFEPFHILRSERMDVELLRIDGVSLISQQSKKKNKMFGLCFKKKKGGGITGRIASFVQEYLCFHKWKLHIL